eukprot:EC118743.1.p1 GENE.EC118743.1~~EC118743.1.p1  ORF type:complete len:116 (+),score=19.98 EC118743.1:69-416(+)
MLRAASLRVFRAPCSRPVPGASARQYSKYEGGHITDAGPKGFSEREHAIEAQYFNKEDEVALKKILKKLETAAVPNDKVSQAEAKLAELVSKAKTDSEKAAVKEAGEAILAALKK